MTESFSGVRMARQDEGDAIYDMLMELHEENGMFRLDPERTRKTINDLLDPMTGIIGVIDGPTGLEGSIGLYITEWWYTSDPHLTEFWNFVRKDCRRSTHAKRLLEFAKWCADHLGIPLHVGIMTNARMEAKQRLYRRFLKPIGAYYMHGITPQVSDEMDASLDTEAAKTELLSAYRGAVKQLMVIPATSRTSRKRAEMEAALKHLRQVQEKADAIMGAA